MRSQEHKSQIFVVISIWLVIKPVEVAPGKSGGGANGNRLDPTWVVQVDFPRSTPRSGRSAYNLCYSKANIAKCSWNSFSLTKRNA